MRTVYDLIITGISKHYFLLQKGTSWKVLGYLDRVFTASEPLRCPVSTLAYQYNALIKMYGSKAELTLDKVRGIDL